MEARMAELTYREAVAVAIAQEMARDDSVVLLGEDVAAAGGVFKTTVGLLEKFGPERVLDTPISEQAILGAAMGAAMTGLRPIAEIMFSDFLAVCWDLVANQIAKTRYMTNGQVGIPLVIRSANGGGARFGAQHSQSVESWAMAIPGLKVVAPSTPYDVVGLFASAVRDDDPVLFFEQKSLYALLRRGPKRRDRRAARLSEGTPPRKKTQRWLRWQRWCTLPHFRGSRASRGRRDRGNRHRRSLTRPPRHDDDPQLSGGDRTARDRRGESPTLRLGCGGRIDRRRGVLLRSRWPDSSRDDAARAAFSSEADSPRRDLALPSTKVADHRGREKALR